jgi:hypothetical protein
MFWPGRQYLVYSTYTVILCKVKAEAGARPPRASVSHRLSPSQLTRRIARLGEEGITMPGKTLHTCQRNGHKKILIANTPNDSIKY